jgi:hypothetical protein
MENQKSGRKTIYKTPEEKAEANRLKAQRYYERNKEKVRKKNLEKYHESKRNKGMADN